MNSNIPWGDAVFEVTPGENAGQYGRSVAKRAGKRAGWIWRAYLRAPCCKALAFVCAGLSGVILWSEVGSLRTNCSCSCSTSTSTSSYKHSRGTELVVSPRLRLYACKVGMNRSGTAQPAHAMPEGRLMWP